MDNKYLEYDSEKYPSYYAILTADVRYDPNLSADAKLLYAEITALSEKHGYCWASNQYFAKIYNTSESSIKRWLKSLEDRGYITREVIYKEGTKEVEKRILKLK